MAAPDLHTQIATLADPGLSDAERITTIRHLEDLKAHASAVQAQLAVDLDHSVRAQHRDLRLPTRDQGRGVAAQIALARRESPARGARLLALAHALAAELPHTRAAMAAGLSEWRATLIARETTCLSPQDRAAVDQQLCAPLPDGTHRYESWGDRRLVAETQKLAYALDPAAVVNRRSKAETERRVTLRPAPDTMAQLTTLLPATQGVAVWATLTAIADTQRAHGDPRTRAQIMADTLVERITGQPRADTVPITINLVVSDQTLLNNGSEPAWLHGYGPLPPDHTRDLTQAAIDQSTAALRRLYATPAAGALVALDSVARTFPKGLRDLIDLRDRTCRTPYCDAPIRHHDHAVPHAAGGPTTALNGQGLCEHCNYAKQAPGWRTRPITGPPGHPHTMETTTPTGHTIRTTAPPLPTPSPRRAHSRAEYHFTQILLAAA
ncbi:MULTISPECIES: HNH endonuclease [unclassified Nocardioides]|uniref:HNH endonuclease n=1 Tax=unclassified Nocardioides TaxID=2615069 RepID=UPI000A26CA3F|nr:MULTISPECIES: HNH endonuclease signature motif containing protein [unclassified Nocardioides]